MSKEKTEMATSTRWMRRLLVVTFVLMAAIGCLSILHSSTQTHENDYSTTQEESPF
ncbi:hypothetical protein ACKC9G_01270 [Pokkaliibacter sp. CJK22405]|uniref:hypothetical protein n=1 Tax=Pokkaliibacter sp. CJK22405 TaxID=3384615 RepID=UPI0039848152